MTHESTIRAHLVSACRQRGIQAEIAKTFEIHPSTVKRWIEGGEISPPMLILLDWYLLGTMPPRIHHASNDLRGILEFDDSEWRIIQILATREGNKTPARWIADKILGYLESNPKAQAVAKEPITALESPVAHYGEKQA